MTTIYKICTAAEWRDAERAGAYRGSAVDRQDGFIHFSTAEQVRETAAKHFAEQADLVLVAVEADDLGAAFTGSGLARTVFAFDPDHFDTDV